MKNKKDVYVVVDTPKKAKKLKKLLDMFEEYIESSTNKDLRKYRSSWLYDISQNPIVVFSDEEWIGSWQSVHKDKTEVSIKELRNILAKEHLKVGDYVVTKSFKVIKITSIDKNSNWFYGEIEGSVDKFHFAIFKRYATPQEIALLEPKPKELEVGKWYKYQYKCGHKGIDGYLLFNFNGKIDEDSQYGFTHTSSGHKFVDDISIYEKDIPKFTEATPQEVESALIEEAKSRGHKYDVYSWNHEQNTLYGNRGNDVGHDILFENGVWSEVIEVDKFAELKEAHKNGAVIQAKGELGYWLNCKKPMWYNDVEYRIKPEEKPKVGDLVKAWNEDNGFVVGVVHRIEYVANNKFGLILQGSMTELYMNFKPLAQQEAIDLLFNK